MKFSKFLFHVQFLYFFLIFLQINCTIDINLPEFEFIADHLTQEECHQLVAALHFHSFEIPKEINSAERKLPNDVSCIDLLLQWNSTPKEGKGNSHVEVAHRLNQIGREDLAEWLSKTVFHQISEDLKTYVNESETEEPISSTTNETAIYEDTKEVDESPWVFLDSLISLFIIFGLITLICLLIYACFLIIRRTSKELPRGYDRLFSTE